MEQIRESDIVSESVNNLQVKFLKKLLPEFEYVDIEKNLSEINKDYASQLANDSFAILAFDTVFSPGIIPTTQELHYRKAYQYYFKNLYNLDVFDNKTQQFIYPNILEFQNLSSNPALYFQEWIANLRAIAVLKLRLGSDHNITNSIKNNLIESALCRMAENGETWVDELVYSLPIKMQERLDRISKEINLLLLEGNTLTPGQFFRIANEIEFNESEYLRGGIEDRISMIIDTYEETSEDEKLSQLAPVSNPFEKNTFNSLKANNTENKLSFKEGRVRGNLSQYFSSDEQAVKLTRILLGIDLDLSKSWFK